MAGASWQEIKVSVVAPDGAVSLLGTAQALRGVARFRDVGIGGAMAGARLQYLCSPCQQGQHGGELISLESEPFDVADFTGGKTIGIHTQPSVSSHGGTVFGQQPVISILDSQGRLVTADDLSLIHI